MRKITEESVSSFIYGRTLNKQNMNIAQGQNNTSLMYLHGNLIAKIENGKLFITNAGWKSNTTKERLNGLPNVRIQQKNGVWYLNGNEWDGQLIEITEKQYI